MSQYVEEMEGAGWVPLNITNAELEAVAEREKYQARLFANGSQLMLRGTMKVKGAGKIAVGQKICNLPQKLKPSSVTLFSMSEVAAKSVPVEIRVNGEVVALVEIAAAVELTLSGTISLV